MKRTLVLQDAWKGYTGDQDKLLTPEETVARFRRRLEKIQLDLLSETVRIDRGRLDIPVYFSLCGADALATIGTKKQMGKGGTPAQAEASAVMELAERFSFFSFSQNPQNFEVAPYEKVRDRAIPFELIAQSVHDASDEQEQVQEIFSRVPLKWTWAFNLTRNEPMLIPFNWFFAINEFNGPSAGNCVEEALCQGICEVVERHVSSLVSRGSLPVPTIDPDSADDPMVQELLGKYDRAGVDLILSDFSLGMGIPSIGVLAHDPSTFSRTSEIVWTAGTTPDPQKALSRALTEVAQLAGDFNSGSNYVASGLPKLRDLEAARFLRESRKTVSIHDLPSLAHPNIRVEVENCVGALSRQDLEVLAVDITHPALQIPAFYTLAPGAHFRERAAGTSVALFTARLISEAADAPWAMQQLRNMEILLPHRYFVAFYQGMVHLSQDRLEEALALFGNALGRDPREEDIPSILSYMGVCLKGLERYEEAIHALKRGQALDRERTDIPNLMGFCYFKLKEYEKAIQCFEEVLRMDPSSAIDYANIASNYREMGKVDKAMEYYALALELDPGISFARENLERLTAKTS